MPITIYIQIIENRWKFKKYNSKHIYKVKLYIVLCKN